MALMYILFAILGLGFLVFIHELGHYLVALKKGMKVETFAIGFGKTIFSFERNGVEWKIGWLPFGGYVKIAGMQKEGSLEPHQVHDGFYSKSPLARIQVALAGPLVNIAFALLAFSAIFFMGGRDKPFTEFTNRIGWVEPGSELYQAGIRPGDVIEKCDGKNFAGFRDLLFTAALKDPKTTLNGLKVNYMTGKSSPYKVEVLNGTIDEAAGRASMIFTPASYLLYQGGMSAGSPAEHSGIAPGDRVIWADGDLVFSLQQLAHLTGEKTVLLTVKREEEVFLTKVPRVHINDLHLGSGEMGELDDWQHEAGIKGKLAELSFIPYVISDDLKVEKRIDFIDEKDQTAAFDRCVRCSLFHPLESGDQILAVDGMSVENSYDLLHKIQTPRVLIVVQRNQALSSLVPIGLADKQFADFDPDELQAIVSSIGTDTPISAAGPLRLLEPIHPEPLGTVSARMDPISYEKALLERKKEIAAINDLSERKKAEEALLKQEERLVLGLPLHDRTIIYNPNPILQMQEGIMDTWRTMMGLFSGALSPKLVSGPVGIVYAVQVGWSHGVKEAIFWLGVISLNLGLVNLLPIPVLDGGHIVFSLYEAVTRRRISGKTMERLVIPFLVLLGLFFLYITYNDILRLFR